MNVESVCPLENFRKFMIFSTCRSYIPEEFFNGEEIFPERMEEKGTMYVEAEDKETLEKKGEIAFIKASNILGVIYNSKSGNTVLKWRSTKENLGKVTGEASANSLVNLFESGVLSKSYAYKTNENEQILES
ncbi:MAG: hypothetical protein NWF08_08155 [Candidatus Bathyarchaeota archaeon]|nr:hypothetical protein [Candidatus Bathyarchaeota archaeon]